MKSRSEFVTGIGRLLLVRLCALFFGGSRLVFRLGGGLGRHLGGALGDLLATAGLDDELSRVDLGTGLSEREVVRPSIAGLMGAYGCAIIAQEKYEDETTETPAFSTVQ